MTTTGLDVFDTTVQQTNRWLNEIGQEMHSEDRHKAYLALRGTLHALRDHLVIDESAQLAAQLPLLIRGIYFEGWNPTPKPSHDRSRKTFLERVDGALTRGQPGIFPEVAARAVFRTIANHISPGEVNQVRQSLPREIRDLWIVDGG
jgi:uncharacterized protein (DUF2267 family)